MSGSVRFVRNLLLTVSYDDGSEEDVFFGMGESHTVNKVIVYNDGYCDINLRNGVSVKSIKRELFETPGNHAETEIVNCPSNEQQEEQELVADTNTSTATQLEGTMLSNEGDDTPDDKFEESLWRKMGFGSK